jgi:hypothetical protein
MRRLTHHWDALMAIAEDLGDGPWIITLNHGGPTVTFSEP